MWKGNAVPAPVVAAVLGAFLSCAGLTLGAEAPKDDEPYAPHTQTLIFYLTGADGQKDVDAISGAISNREARGIEYDCRDREVNMIQL
jgi:hypothetical protein